MIGQEIQLKVESLAHGGAAVGRAQDFVFFVPFAAPGDEIQARVTEVKKNYAEAELIKIIAPGPRRVTPPCEVFGKCGGCQWQHVSYEEQLQQKQNIVMHALSRIAKEQKFEVKPIIASPEKFNYRNRVQVRTLGSAAGFYRKGSHELVSFDKCHIVEPSINDEISKIKAEIINYRAEHESKIEIFIAESGKTVRSQDQNHGEEFGFAQVNTKQNKQMIAYVQSLIGNPQSGFGRSSLLELFCGNGNFSMPLIENGWDVYGIDGNRAAISDAREKLRLISDKNKNTGFNPRAFFSSDDATAGVEKLLDQRRTFETLLVDPPRTGMTEPLVNNIAEVGVKTLVYVSCNPATFARDWARIKAATKLKLVSVQPFDMFPQTFHVELVALATL